MPNKKIISVAIVGCGARGAEAYGRLFHQLKDKYSIVALCDINQAALEKYATVFDIEKTNCFCNEDEFFQAKRADLVVIGTLDADHVRQCLKALKVGYDIMMEKPITAKKEECEALLAAQKQYGGKIIVCHVLRYSPSYKKVKELLDSNIIGRLVAIQSLEPVGYWHQAHSYVRGNWRREEDTTPMILAKCCHDLDLLQYYAQSKCESISSVGDLTYFKAENAPEGTAKRCLDCKDVNTCPYSAKRIYIDNWKKDGTPENVWPYNVLTPEIPLTEKALRKAIQEGPYGRCVYHCDNNVVDHQITQMTFENGVKATLTMTAFTIGGGRVMRFFGTLGEIDFNDPVGYIVVRPFGEMPEKIDINKLVQESGGYAHGGGDYGLISALYDALCGNNTEETTLTASIESHLMGIYAEKSRKEKGKLIYIHK